MPESALSSNLDFLGLQVEALPPLIHALPSEDSSDEVNTWEEQ